MFEESAILEWPHLTLHHFTRGDPWGTGICKCIRCKKGPFNSCKHRQKNTIDMYKHIKTQYDSLCILSGWWNAKCMSQRWPNSKLLHVSRPIATGGHPIDPSLTVQAISNVCFDVPRTLHQGLRRCEQLKGDTQKFSQVWKSQNQGFWLKAVK